MKYTGKNKKEAEHWQLSVRNRQSYFSCDRKKTSERIEERKKEKLILSSLNSYSTQVTSSNDLYSYKCMYVTLLKIRKVSNNGNHITGLEEEKVTGYLLHNLLHIQR